MNKEPFECAFCGKAFNKKYLWAAHHRNCNGGPLARDKYTCEMCNKIFSTKTNLRRHQNRNKPCIDVMICEKCGQRCFGGQHLGKHMQIHECTCVRCGEDHTRKDERAIIPLEEAFADDCPSVCCTGCFADIRGNFVALICSLQRKNIKVPRNIRNVLLMWIFISEC